MKTAIMETALVKKAIVKTAIVKTAIVKAAIVKTAIVTVFIPRSTSSPGGERAGAHRGARQQRAEALRLRRDIQRRERPHHLRGTRRVRLVRGEGHGVSD